MRALQKHFCRCLLASWNLDQNLGETYDALKWKINLHRFRSSEGTLTSVCVYEPETIKLNTDHYFRTWERHTNMSWKSLTGLAV